MARNDDDRRGKKGIVTTFVRAESGRFQIGKIIAMSMVPRSVKPPISLDWVYLEKWVTTDEEVHPINKIFTIIGGAATVFVGDAEPRCRQWRRIISIPPRESRSN
jgi:hypothetical protein